MIDILYEDGEALVINKPAGLPLDPPRRGGPSLQDHLGTLTLGFKRLPQPVHRLDTDTSGCLLLARNPKALRRFSRAFEDRRVTKVYCGVLAGRPEAAEGCIALALSKISSAAKGWRMIPAKKGKEAGTGWRVLEVRGDLSLIEFTPKTGRTHQLRVHAAHGLGAALLSDPIYGTPDPRARRTMLHASSLTLERPGKPDITAAAPLPDDFQALGFLGGF